MDEIREHTLSYAASMRMTSRDDIEYMIQRIAMGDKAAFSSLYDATSAKLFAVCLRVLHDQNDAEDALQETYVRVWNKSKTYSVTGHSPMTWLITIARNLAIDRLRARSVSMSDITDAIDIADDRPGPEAIAIKRSERTAINDCLEELEENRANAVKRAYLYGDTYKDLAYRYDVPLNTIRTWLRRSLMTLKDCLSR